jgi:hypothetical protein
LEGSFTFEAAFVGGDEMCSEVGIGLFGYRFAAPGAALNGET